jgi:hypothetical protein
MGGDQTLIHRAPNCCFVTRFYSICDQNSFPFTQATYRLNAITIAILLLFFTEIEKQILKFIWKPQKTLKIAKAILSKKNRARGLTVSDVKTDHQVTRQATNRHTTGARTSGTEQRSQKSPLALQPQ